MTFQDQLVLWLGFTLCLSMTAGGVLVLFRFGHTRSKASFHYLQYFLILLHVYGYYSLWSAIMLPRLSSLENTQAIATVVSQLGAPFFILSLLMLQIWLVKLQNRSMLIVPVTITTTFLLTLAFLYWAEPETDRIRAASSMAGLIFTATVTGLLLTGSEPIVGERYRYPLVALAFAAAAIHLSTFTDLTTLRHYEVLFAVYFYLFNTALTVVYAYQATDEGEQVQTTQPTIDDFFIKFGISKREADIVMCIYAGKTNQEIANQLFITLQTVKDHSSRIYQKTFVKNRAQLTTLIRESQGGVTRS